MPKYDLFGGIFPPKFFGDLFTITISELSHSYKQLSDEDILDQLKKSYKNKQLSLIIGSGVSKSCGLPNWNELLKELLIKCFDYEISLPNLEIMAEYFIKENNQLIIARYIQQHLKNKDKNSFEETVRNTLYNHPIEESTLIREICQLFNSEMNPSLDSIITYNYDDILETHLRKLKIPHRVIHNVGMMPKEGEFPIYHVHGFLPKRNRLTSKNKIVLSEEIYHKQYLDTYNWSNITQINKFSEKTCLFIGTSLTDPNMRRLLDIASLQRKDEEKPHFIIKVKPNGKENLCNSILHFEAQDAWSLGINTLWVNNFEEIPRELSKIKN